MNRLLRFSPARLALAYFRLTVLVLALFAIPLWYAWRVNLSPLRTYVPGEVVQRFVDVFERELEQTGSRPRWTPSCRSYAVTSSWCSPTRRSGGLPKACRCGRRDSRCARTYGLLISVGGGETTRVVSHVRLRGGYHLLVGRESVRFESLVASFWHGIIGAIGIALVLGALIRWMIRRALLSEVHEISRTASAIAEGDLTRRVPARVPQPDLLPGGRQGRALRGLGPARALRSGAARGVQILAVAGNQ